MIVEDISSDVRRGGDVEGGFSALASRTLEELRPWETLDMDALFGRLLHIEDSCGSISSHGGSQVVVLDSTADFDVCAHLWT